MKKDKIKKFSLIFGVVFFLLLLFLTYFSSTIDKMLIPNVKTTEVVRASLSEEGMMYSQEDRFLVPVKAVSDFGDNSTVYTVNWVDGDYYVGVADIQIIDTDGMYYEVTSSGLYGGNQIIYSTSKSLQSGDRVYVVEG
ncbi:MAG: hypothetical protein IJZ54_01575 [Clostridia bacterium]|nr:hypothetical protein [Clostridia bacterium]